MLAFLAPGAGPAWAQWPPDSLTNLKVFPKDIPVRELIGEMRGIAGALGVRCTYCHVGDDPNDLRSIDFAADDKETKRKARVMLRMVKHINGEHLEELPGRSDPPVRVTCETCHHGLNRPGDLRTVMVDLVVEQGVDSAVARYGALREEYYGGWSYDFSPSVLRSAAETLARGHGEAEGALALLELNAELYPEYAATFMTMAQVQANLQQDFEGAEASLERVLELDPENSGARRALGQLRSARGESDGE
jgi:hypothetical protein